MNYIKIKLTDLNKENIKFDRVGDIKIIDAYYARKTIETDFALQSPHVKNNSLFRGKIIDFIHKYNNRCFAEDTNELMICVKDLIKDFHTTNYKVAMEFLYSIGYLIKVPIYCADNKINNHYYNKDQGIATTYRFKPMSDNMHHVYLFTSNKTNKYTENLKVKLNKKEIETLRETKIDKASAINAEVKYHHDNMTSSSQLYKRLNKILTFGDYIYTKKGTKSKRIFHNLSNISRVSRKYITYKNKSFNNIDIKNSQILFLLAYLNDNRLPYDDNFKTDVLNGVIYDRFYNKDINQKESVCTLGTWHKKQITFNIGDNRDQVKEELFKSIFFNFNTDYSMNKHFQMIYPKTWESLNKIYELYKDNDKINLAILLQNIEYDAFQNIPLKSKAYFNLFDSIYYTDQDDTQMIIDHLSKFFSDLGINDFKYTLND